MSACVGTVEAIKRPFLPFPPRKTKLTPDHMRWLRLRVQTRSQSFVPLNSAVGKRELCEHLFRACAIDTIDANCTLGSETGYAEFGYFLCYFKMDAPRVLVFRPLVKGNEALGTRLLRVLLCAGMSFAVHEF